MRALEDRDVRGKTRFVSGQLLVWSFPVLVMGLLFALLAGCGGRSRIAFVDLQRALNETSEGKQAKASIREVFGERQRDLNKRQEVLRDMETKVKGQKTDSNDEAYEHQMGVLKTAFVDLQSTYQQYQTELERREAEAVQEIMNKMKGLLSEVADREKYKAIFEINEGGAFYYDKSLDLTDEFIRLYNERHPGQ